MRNKILALLNKKKADNVKKTVCEHRAHTGGDYKLADILKVDDFKDIIFLNGEDILFLMDEGYTDGQIIDIIRMLGANKKMSAVYVCKKYIILIANKGASPELVKVIKYRRWRDSSTIGLIILVGVSGIGIFLACLWKAYSMF